MYAIILIVQYRYSCSPFLVHAVGVVNVCSLMNLSITSPAFQASSGQLSSMIKLESPFRYMSIYVYLVAQRLIADTEVSSFHYNIDLLIWVRADCAGSHIRGRSD